MKLKGIKPREYQQKIFETCKDKNCLVVLPTGMGKSLVGVLLAMHRLEEYPESKVLILAPTRPLISQWLSYFKKHVPELFASLELFTGRVPAEKRKKVWENVEIIFSTPQCLENDIKNNLYNLQNVSLLVEDECITKDTEIKLSGGSITNIKKLFENFKEDNKIYVESLGKNGEIEPARILKVHRIKNKKKILKIKTKNKKIKTTEDHLLLVKDRFKTKWIGTKNLKQGDEIATDIEINKEKYTDKVLIDKKDIAKKYGDSLHQTSASLKTIKRLKEKDLLPLKYSNPKLKIIVRLTGHIFGDGWFTKVKGKPKLIGFSGEIEDLKRIQKDLDILGIKYTKIHSRKTTSLINTYSKKRIFVNGTSNSFSVTDSCLVKLIDALNIFAGDKTINPFLIPKWIMDAPKFIKKEFLSSLMGSEGDTPKIRKNRFKK